MPVGRPTVAIVLTEEEKSSMLSIVRASSQPQGFVRRVQIVLAAAEGLSNTQISERLKVSQNTVGKWRRRYCEHGLAGLRDLPRPGCPCIHDDEQVAKVIKTALESKPPGGATHWSVRSMAAHTGISKTMVHVWFVRFGIQPHRQRHFKVSNDPQFVDKVRDIVGLYRKPPDNAVVLCVDEKTQVQALERTQPMLPMGLNHIEGMTHDYKRHGTTTLFAALDVANGNVLTQCRKRHRHQEFLSFLRLIDANVPRNLDVHLVLDNYCTHKHSKVKAWLARRPRFKVHYTPTYASWLNQVECWFSIITRQAIRRGSFTSVRQLMAMIRLFVKNYNEKATPFVWVATAESILAKLKRLYQVIYRTAH